MRKDPYVVRIRKKRTRARLYEKNDARVRVCPHSEDDKKYVYFFYAKLLFLRRYSCGVIPVCCLKYLLKKDRLLNPKENAISLTVRSVERNWAFASIVMIDEMISKGVSPIAFFIVVQK